MKKYIVFVLVVTSVLFVFINFKSDKIKENNPQLKSVARINELPLNWPWRGITIITHDDTENIDSLSIKDLKDEGINFVRLRIGIRSYSKLKKVSVEKSQEKTFAFCDNVIRWCKHENIAVLLSYTEFPLDPSVKITQNEKEFWENPKMLDESIKFIGDFVQHFDKKDNVVGYDFFPEPNMKDYKGKTVQPLDWDEYYKRMLSEIRKHSQKYVTYTPGPWGPPKNYQNMGNPIADNRIIYNFHFYEPHRYTHQGVKSDSDKDEKFAYPGKIGNKEWDRNEIKKEVGIAHNWCKKNNQLLFSGEFSAVIWAEGRENYLEDVLSVFEELNVSYSYFAYNGYKAWSYANNYDASSKQFIKANEKTKTQKILEKYWSLNNKNN